MPKTTALALSVAATAGAGALLIAGAVIPAIIVVAVSLVFDLLFVQALRTRKQDRR